MNSDLGHWEGRRRDSLPIRHPKAVTKTHSRTHGSDLVIRSRFERPPSRSHGTVLYYEKPLLRAATFDDRYNDNQIKHGDFFVKQQQHQQQTRKQISRSGRRTTQKQRRNSDYVVPADVSSRAGLGLGFGLGHGSNRPWPPRRHSLRSVMTSEEAEEVVCRGASTFKGDFDPVPRMESVSYRFFAVMKSEYYGRTDRAAWHNEAFRQISYSLTGPSDSAFPWMSLEQPSMESCFGRRPGTTTLNYVVGTSGCAESPILYGTDVRPKKIKLMAILERLRQLEAGLDESNPNRLYQSLYGELIYEVPDDARPHYAMELQISDLITVLSHADWTDFRLFENHTVAEHFDSPDTARKHQFLHQLLLSMELYLRIHSPSHHNNAKRRLLQRLPPKISWDLALAERWLENISISKVNTSTTKSTFRFDLRSKKRQKDALRVFARILKWPNLGSVNQILDEKTKRQVPVEDLSAETMSWFTGVILPGPSLPLLVMSSLITCDGETGGTLGHLSQIHSAAGFQHRANTYWLYNCIVGKVLGGAKGVKQVGGWIGPCHFSPDLERSECVRIKQLKPRKRHSLNLNAVQSMAQRTDPLGPKRDVYPVADFDVPLPDTDDIIDTIRLEKLSFHPVGDEDSSMDGHGTERHLSTFHASIIFASSGRSCPLELLYDVDFVTAYPCYKGPHVLHCDYAYRAVKVDDGLLEIRNWALKSRDATSRRNSSASELSHKTVNTSSTHSSLGNICDSKSPRSRPTSEENLKEDDKENSPVTDQSLQLTTRPQDSCLFLSPQSRPESRPDSLVSEVLVIEALGVSDNEVFARAWCAQWGCSAIIANLNDTCLACAVREAYAADIAVVIATEGGRKEEEDEAI